MGVELRVNLGAGGSELRSGSFRNAVLPKAASTARLGDAVGPKNDEHEASLRHPPCRTHAMPRSPSLPVAVWSTYPNILP